VMKANKHNAVPTIMGTNEDEGSIFVPMMVYILKFNISFPLKENDIWVVMNHFFGPNTTLWDDIFAKYIYPNPDYTHIVSIVLRDYFFVCTSRRALHALHTVQPNFATYMYHFIYKGDFVEDPVLGDYHSSELEFTWANAWPPVIHRFTANDTQMSADFVGFFSNFIHTQNPNTPWPRAVEWPEYLPESEENVMMALPLGEESKLTESKCLFWDQEMLDEQNEGVWMGHFPDNIMQVLTQQKTGDGPVHLSDDQLKEQRSWVPKVPQTQQPKRVEVM